MKKKLIIFFFILMFPAQVCAEPLLYDVLKDQAESGQYALEYTGEHQDLYDGTGDQKIYHYYSNSRSDTEAIKNLRNVIFGGYCWEMLRTTDAGGIRMIYNGKAYDGQCSDNRPPSIKNNGSYTYSLYVGDSYYNFYYADGYTYNGSNGYFYLDDTKEAITVEDLTPEKVIGKYTLTSRNENNGGWNIKKITGYDTSTHVLSYDSYSAAPIYSIGTSSFSDYDHIDSIASVGYMRNRNDEIEYKTNINYGSLNISSTRIEKNQYEVVKNNTSYPATFNTSTNRWSISVPSSASYGSSSDITFKVTTAGSYILKFNTSNTSGSTTISLNNKKIANFSGSFTGVQELNNLIPNDEIKVYYYPAGYTTALYFSVEIPNGNPTSDTRTIFGNDIKYENGQYTLVDTIKNDGSSYLDYHHYTCFNTTGKCQTVSYVSRWEKNSAYSYKLSNGQNITDLLNEMLIDDGVNKNDSPVKALVDSWFEENLIDYLSYLEDSIYCNDRTIETTDTDQFNPNGGTETSRFRIKPYYSTDPTRIALKCPVETGCFSVSNPKAQLKYPIAIPNVDDMLLQTGKYSNYEGDGIRAKTDHYLLMTPEFYGTLFYNFVIQSNGQIYGMYGSDVQEIRPVITLKAGTQYIQGDGSVDNPYVVREYNYYEAAVDNEKEKGTVIFNDVDDPENILEETVVTITVKPEEGYVLGAIKIVDEEGNEIPVTPLLTPNEYQFTMPRTSVTIIPTYEKIEAPVPINPETRDTIIGIFVLAFISLGFVIYFRNKQKDII